MFQSLLSLDYQLFEWVNSGLQNEFFDVLMPYWRSKYTWIPLYVLLAIILLYRYRLAGLWLILAAVLTIGISDTLSSKVIKKSVERLRPCKTTAIATDSRLLIKCGSGYSFPSSHATNHFALAIFLMLTLGRRFTKLKLPLAIWAASIAFGQVYVGVHFPLDVVVGALLGAGVGWLVAYLYFSFTAIRIAEFYSI